MKLATMAKILVTGLALCMMVVEVAAKDPIFVKWLVADDPGDQTIRTYWERAETGDLGARELVDLGTMLYYRGWSSSAVDYFREALDIDPNLSEAWFRIGLVKHHGGDLSGARAAYRKCLNKQSGHGWGNFYLGLLEEQRGNGKKAMEHFEMAFRHAPELADPRVNPEITSSRLQLGAQIRHFDRERFERATPMPFLDPAAMREVKRSFAPPKPSPPPTSVPTAVPTVSPTPTPKPEDEAKKARKTKTRKPAMSKNGSSGGAKAGGSAKGGSATGGSRGAGAGQSGAKETPFGFPTPPPETAAGAANRGEIGETSPEASLRPLWPGLYAVAEALV